MSLKATDIQIIFTNVPMLSNKSVKNNLARVFNINSTLNVIFKELEKYSSLPERYFKLKYCQKEYNYMERNKKIIDIFDNENKVAIVDILISTKIDRDIFALQEKELNEAPLEKKIKYVNYLTKYASNLPEKVEIHKEYKKLFLKYKKYIFDENK